MFFTLFGISVAAAVAADIYDVTLTAQGLKKGIAQEGFTWLIGSKPSTLVLYLRDALITGVVAMIPLTLFLLGSVPVAYGTLSGLLVLAVKHVQGYRQWKWMFAHPGQLLPVQHSIWAKFLGFWG